MEHPDWLTQDFINKVLGGVGQLQDALVEGAVPSGENYCSDLIRVSVAGKSVVVKVKPQGNIIKLVRYMKMFEKESAMYTFLDELENILCEKMGPRRIPHPHLLVLEDLKAQGFRPTDRRRQLGLEQCHIALEALAKFHVGSVPLLPRFPEFDEELYFRADSPFPHILAPMIEALADEIETWPESAHYAPRMRKYAQTIFEKTAREVLAPKKFVVLNHGDFHSFNLMFQGGKVALVDFQFPRINSPAMDIIYFMMTSVRPDVRKYHRKDLLKTYIDTFNLTAEKLQLSQRFNPDSLEREIEQFKNFAMITASVRTALILSDSVNDVREHAIDDVSPTSIYRSKAYRQVMPILLKEFGDLGVF